MSKYTAKNLFAKQLIGKAHRVAYSVVLAMPADATMEDVLTAGDVAFLHENVIPEHLGLTVYKMWSEQIIPIFYMTLGMAFALKPKINNTDILIDLDACETQEEFARFCHKYNLQRIAIRATDGTHVTPFWRVGVILSKTGEVSRKGNTFNDALNDFKIAVRPLLFD